MSRERGMALLVVLWATAGMALLATGLVRAATGEVRRSHDDLLQLEARLAIESGFARAVAGVRDSDPERRWLPDGTVRRLQLDRATVAIKVEDEAARIDLNGAAPELLRGLLEAIGGSREQIQPVVDAIVDWRDEDHERSLQGAERAEYAAAGRSYGPADRPFLVAGELRAVLPVTTDLYRRIAPFVTVFTGASTIDPLWAPREVLLALPGVGEADVARIEAERRKKPPPQTQDIAQLLPGANAVIGPAQRPLLRITLDAEIDGRVRRTATIVATLDDNAEQARLAPRWATVLDWRDEIPGRLLAGAEP